jgi:hypothetical protein
MTMVLPASPPAPARSSELDQILRVVILLFGAIEGILHVRDLIPSADISVSALHPLIGFAAVAFALTKRLRLGIAALALLALVQWANEAPYVIRDGISWSGSTFLNAEVIFRTMIQPIIGCAAIAAAWFNRHLTVATLAVVLPTLVKAAGIAAFAISVMLYGF